MSIRLWWGNVKERGVLEDIDIALDLTEIA
jgi:hypothetical protein